MTNLKVVLVTGGTGYIGSHVILALLSHGGFMPIALDNLANSYLGKPSLSFQDSGSFVVLSLLFLLLRVAHPVFCRARESGENTRANWCCCAFL